MDKVYTVKAIYEADYGCEELMPNEESMVDVVLEDEKGSEQIVSEKDSRLYDLNINIGDKVVITEEGIIKV